MDILQLLVFIVIAIVLIMLVGKVSFSKHTQSIHIRLFGMVDFEAHFMKIMTIRILISSCCFPSCVCILNLLNGSVVIIYWAVFN